MDKNEAGNQLNSFFLRVVRQSFWQLGINDATVASYVADVLTDFARADNLYKVRIRKGRKAQSAVDMLVAKPNPPGEETDLLVERKVRKYVGDYTLFMSGIFRRYVEDNGFLEFYLEEGSRSYRTVSELDLSLYRTGFNLFQELSKKFEYYSGALDYIRKANFASEPGNDPFAGFFRQFEGWMKINLTDN